MLVDIPKNVQQATTNFKPKQKVKLKSYNPTYKPNAKQLRKVVDLIKAAKRPLIFAGGGVILSKGAEELTRLARTARIPVTIVPHGTGAPFPRFRSPLAGNDRHARHLPGQYEHGRMRSTHRHRRAFRRSGNRQDGLLRRPGRDRAHRHRSHLDPQERSGEHSRCGATAKASLQTINKYLAEEDMEAITANRGPWLDQIEQWRQNYKLAYEQDEAEIKPQYVIEKLYELTKGQAIITTEVGQNQMWAAQYYHFDQPGHFVTSGGLGTMGFGLPAAIGAQVAFPRCPGGGCGRRRQHPDEHPGNGHGPCSTGCRSRW